MIAGGLAFAIPSQSVSRFLAGPAEEYGGLGVVVRPVWLERTGQQIGLVVLEVIPNSAADRASLLQGDILVGARGQRFQAIQDLEIAIHSSRGGVLDLQFRRGASANIRTVAAQMAAGTAKAA
jgi:S1-C subfamily serine protease